MKMTVLVTGGAGYIGSHTLYKLLESGFNPIAYDNLSTGFLEALPLGVEFVKGDILDLQLLTQTMIEKKVEAVIHFAAKLIVPESIIKPLEYYENNTQGVICLAKACKDAGVKKVVFSSTAAVYGDANTKDLIQESTPISPLNPYGFSKWMSEQILRDCEKSFGLKSICLRYFNVAGAALKNKNGQRTKNATHLIKVASEAATGKRSFVEVFGYDYPTQDGTGVRDYIHIDDLADIHVLSLKHLFKSSEVSSQVYNCGYGKGFSVKEVLKTMQKVSRNEFQIQMKSRRPGDAAQLVANTSLLRSQLHWEPRHADLELICRSAYEWEKSQ